MNIITQNSFNLFKSKALSNKIMLIDFVSLQKERNLFKKEKSV
jgi:hypothetical protein